jgi:hypothetical protein
MAYIKCFKCGEIIEIPPELTPENWAEHPLEEYPVLCDACENFELADVLEHDDE